MFVFCHLHERGRDAFDTVIKSGIGFGDTSGDECIKNRLAGFYFLLELSESKFFFFQNETQSVVIGRIKEAFFAIISLEKNTLIHHRHHGLVSGESLELAVMSELNNRRRTERQPRQIDALFGLIESELVQEWLKCK